MKRSVLGIIALVVLAAGAVFVVAQRSGHRGDPMGMGPGHGQMMGLGLRGLDLTDEQKAGVKTIMEASRTNVEPLMAQMHDSRSKLEAIGTDGTFDQAQVEALANEQAGTMAKLIVEREKAKSQIFALLTDAQKAKAAEMRVRFGEKMKGRRGVDKKPESSTF